MHSSQLFLAAQPAGIPGTASTDSTATTAQTAAPSNPDTSGPAPAGGCSSLGGNGMLLVFAVPLLLMFLMTRSQNKKQKDLEAGLKVGDRVITRSGAIGKIVEVGDRIMKLELAPGVNVQFLKTSIEGVDTGDPKDTKKTDDKKDDKKSSDDKKDDKKSSDDK